MRLGSFWLAAVAVAFFATLCLPAQQWGTRPNGSALPELAPPNTPAIVLFFVATDCPVSNRTFPEMARLREEFSPRGVRFWYVYPNDTERSSDIASHQQAFDSKGEPLLDTNGSLLRLTHAIVTPEIAILTPGAKGWHAVYTGRIDNRFMRLGQERPIATERFGEAAIAAVLAGKSPLQSTGAPVGCAIMNAGSKPAK